MATLYELPVMTADITSFLSAISVVDPYLHLFSQVLVLSGLRITEVIETSRCSFDDESPEPPITWQTKKGSNDRHFEANFFPSLFYEKIKNDNNYFRYVNKSTYSYQFKKLFPKKNIKHDSKNLTSSFFRHFVAKEMKAYGYTDTQIQDFFGEKELYNMQNYIYSEIYYGD